jgi:putative aldouronate transport system permease protein
MQTIEYSNWRIIMVEDNSLEYKTFSIFNGIFLFILSFLCIFPVLNVFAISLSSAQAVAANKVFLFPVEFTVNSYIHVIRNGGFGKSFSISVLRAVIGTIVNLIMIVITAYPLSRDDNELKGRNGIMWFFVISMLFSGGLIPTYILIRDLRLLNNFWVLILPGCVQIYNIILVMNFFRRLPKGLYEAALIDGASHLTVLFRIFIPLSKASLATITLFSIVGHWNAWFDGLIYITDTKKWPLQTYLKVMIENQKGVKELVEQGYDASVIASLSSRTVTAAQIFVAMLPIFIIYPFLQKYFVKGIVLGSVKE